MKINENWKEKYGIRVLDHVIVTQDGQYESLKNKEEI
jgi:DNA repair protein RadC